MTKKQVEQLFKLEVMPYIREQYEQDGRADWPARREAWNNFTDSLCKDGQITSKQYSTWDNPY